MNGSLVKNLYSSITSLTNVYRNPECRPFPYVFDPVNVKFVPPAVVVGIRKNYQWPYFYQLNLSVERQLPGNVSVSTAYVGTLSHDLPLMRDNNYAAYATGSSTSQASINSRYPYSPGVLGSI